jgi:hypothetical protein
LYDCIITGPFNITVDDIRSTMDLTGHVVNDTWIVEHARPYPSVKKLKMYFDILHDNKQLSKY